MRPTQIRPDGSSLAIGSRIHQTGRPVAPFDSQWRTMGPQPPAVGSRDISRGLRFRSSAWAAFARAGVGPSSVLELSRHLGGEIGAMAIDPLAEGEAREAGHPNRRAGGFRRLLNHQRYFALLVDDKNLLE